MPGFGLPSIHGLVSAAVGTVNPFVLATVQHSTGAAQNADFSRTPTSTSVSVSCQVQAMSGRDLRQLEGLNLQNVTRKLYIAGSILGVIRTATGTGKGGDTVVFPAGTLPEGDRWLVTIIFEQWPQWAAVGLTLQLGS